MDSKLNTSHRDKIQRKNLSEADTIMLHPVIKAAGMSGIEWRMSNTNHSRRKTLNNNKIIIAITISFTFFFLSSFVDRIGLFMKMTDIKFTINTWACFSGRNTGFRKKHFTNIHYSAALDEGDKISIRALAPGTSQPPALKTYCSRTALISAVTSLRNESSI